MRRDAGQTDGARSAARALVTAYPNDSEARALRKLALPEAGTVAEAYPLAAEALPLFG